jgi:hypothetical protein
MKKLVVAWMAWLLVASDALAAEPLWVQLGPQNDEHGLSVASGGDGANAPDTLGGSPCRRTDGEKSLYLYVKADDARVPPGRYDAYLAVEYFDDSLDLVHVQYDKAPVVREVNSFYSGAEDLILRTGSRAWRRTVLRLPDARLGKGQNFGSDLRLVGNKLAVRRIELHLERPAEYRPGGIDPAILDKFRTQIDPRMELTFGVDADGPQALLLRTLGVTSIESYVTWQTVEDRGQDQWDWSHWDQQVDTLRRHGLKWVPFLVAGPGYATPKWYRESSRSVPYVCLEHGEASKIQSLWNPEFRPWIERFIKTFAERYRQGGMIESVLLGVSGTYGETLYPSGPPEGWTYQIPGMFHNHRGWWAGDKFAAADFRRYLRGRYGEIAVLNRAWGTQHASFDVIAPMLPEKAPSPVARLDVAQWYVQAMTDWAAFWVATTRKHFPNTPIYLCVGGAGEPELGADFSAQAKAIAPYGARIRITNEASNYPHNYVITREVATAGRAFGLDFGFEPAGHVSGPGNVARIYNATASGAIQLFCYHGNVLQEPEGMAHYMRYASFLQRRSPQVDAAVYLSKVSWALDEHSQDRQFTAAREIRDRLDFEFLDPTTLATPLARRLRVLALPDAPYATADEIESLRQWIAAGGILVAQVVADRPLLRTPDGSDALRNRLLATPPAGLALLRPAVRGPVARHFRLEIGKTNDGGYLWGDWHGREGGGMFADIPGAAMRWTGARAGISVPCDPSTDATLVLTVNLPGQSVKTLSPSSPRPQAGEGQGVKVNGTLVGTLDKPGRQSYRFAVPRKVLGDRVVAEVTLQVRTFRPSEHGSRDTRDLGVAVCSVEMIAQGAEQEPPVATPLVRELDWSKAGPCLRSIGKGATLAVPCRDGQDFGEALVRTLETPEKLIPGASGIALPSPEPDAIYATQFAEGVLYYSDNDQPRVIRGVTVPARGIAWEPRTQAR